MRQHAEPIDAGDQMSRRKRSIGQIRPGIRRLNVSNNSTPRMAAAIERQLEGIHANAELYSHADTVVAGSSCKVIELTNNLARCILTPTTMNLLPTCQLPRLLPHMTTQLVAKLTYLCLARLCTWVIALSTPLSAQTKHELMGWWWMISPGIYLMIIPQLTPFISLKRTFAFPYALGVSFPIFPPDTQQMMKSTSANG